MSVINIHTASAGTTERPDGLGGFAAIIEYEGQHLTLTGGDHRTNRKSMRLSALVIALRMVNQTNNIDMKSKAVRLHSLPVHIAKHLLNPGTGRPEPKQLTHSESYLWTQVLQELRGHPCTLVSEQDNSQPSIQDRCKQLANEQAHHTQAESGYWCSMGNPNTFFAFDQPDWSNNRLKEETAISLQRALDEAETAAKAINEAIFIDNNYPDKDRAHRALLQAEKALTRQKETLVYAIRPHRSNMATNTLFLDTRSEYEDELPF